MSIGTRLKELRESIGLTQVQAAARVGMKQQAWRVYETDASMPGAKLIVKICGEYGVTSDWLLGLRDSASLRETSVNAGAGAAVAIGANARATVRGTFAAPEENQTHGALCFFLGLLLGPLGVIAAAVVSKAAGARFALSGFGLWIFIWLFFFR